MRSPLAYRAPFLAALLLSAPLARAAEPEAAPAPTAVASPPTETPAPEPAAKPVTAPDAKPKTGRALVVHRWGLGYFGQMDVPIGWTGARAAGSSVPLQMVGARTWLGRVRLDLAVGVNLQGGSNDVDGASSSQPSFFAWGARVAAPIALYSAQNFTVFLGPEIAYGRANESTPAVAENPVTGERAKQQVDHSGHRFALGARGGAEVHFGFMGLPRLALDATLGLSLDLTAGYSDGIATKSLVTNGSASYSHVGLQSFTSHQPWNIFITNVAAVYYF